MGGSRESGARTRAVCTARAATPVDKLKRDLNIWTGEFKDIRHLFALGPRFSTVSCYGLDTTGSHLLECRLHQLERIFTQGFSPPISAVSQCDADVTRPLCGSLNYVYVA